MNEIDSELLDVLIELSNNGPCSVEDSKAVKLFNKRLIDYEIGAKWKINLNGQTYLKEQEQY